MAVAASAPVLRLGDLTLDVPVVINGTAVQELSTSAVDQAASTTRLAKAEAGQLLRAMSRWASGSKMVRAWNATTTS